MESLSDLFKDKRKLHKLGEQVQFNCRSHKLIMNITKGCQISLKLICYIRFLFFLKV